MPHPQPVPVAHAAALRAGRARARAADRRDGLDTYRDIWGGREAGGPPVELGLAAAILAALVLLAPLF